MNRFKLYILPALMMIGMISQVNAQVDCPLACIDQTVIVLENSSDIIEVLPSDVLFGDYSSCTNFDPTVTILYLFTDEVHPNSPNVGIDEVDELLQVQIEDQTTGNACWSRLVVMEDGPIDLTLGSGYAALGQDLCIPLTATNFVNISDFDMSFTWDPSVLQFKNLEEGALWATALNQAKTAEGKLGFEWINNGVAPVNWVLETTPLITLCFETLAETSGSEICFGSDPTPGEVTSWSNGTVDPGLICGSAYVAACKVNCIPDLTVTVSSDEERNLAADYFLLRGTCDFPNLSLAISDASGADLGNTVNGANAGQTLTATLSDSDTGSSCQTNLTVEVCDSDPVNIEVAQRFEGSELIADVRVDNFSEIAGYQFTLLYDPAVLDFESFITADDLDFDPILNASSNDGKLIVVRPSPSGFPATVQDGETLLSVRFAVLKEENTTLSFGSDPVELIFLDDQLNELCVNAPDRAIAITGAGAKGYIYDDVNKDCAADAGDLSVKNWLVEMVDQATGDKYYDNTDADGYYLIYAPPGNYTLSAYAANDLWSFCDNNFAVTVQNDDDRVEQDFYTQADILCPELSVDLSVPFLRRCFDNTYHLTYCNDGTTVASDAYITVDLDEYMTFVNSSTPFTVNGQQVTFDLGDVAYGDCGDIAFTVILDCEDTTLGQTHCVEAQIFPVVDCLTANPEWSGASLVIDGECDGQNLEFKITNVGVGDMTKALEFIVIEDDVMKEGAPIELGAGESYDLAPLEADGSTYRISIPQVEGHPGMSTPTLAIEGCGTNSIGTFSTGFVTMFSNNDGDSYIDIDCSESIGSWDPNDKAVAPKGYTDRKYVSANTDLDYKIRFQNTGTDTAFRVVIRDVIEEDLDLSTLKLGAASHDYTLAIEEGRTLVFTFDDIYLVDSTRNEPASHGFIKFKIAQHADKPDGTFLTNDADIFFDFNEAVETNTTELEIGSADGTYTNDFAQIDLNVFPNPTADKINISHSYTDGNVRIKIYDQQGRLMRLEEIQNDDSVSLADFPAGIYDYRLMNKKRILAVGKISKM